MPPTLYFSNTFYLMNLSKTGKILKEKAQKINQ